MENLIGIGIFLACLGAFFIGVSCIWWVAMQESEKSKE